MSVWEVQIRANDSVIPRGFYRRLGEVEAGDLLEAWQAAWRVWQTSAWLKPGRFLVVIDEDDFWRWPHSIETAKLPGMFVSSLE